MPIKILHLEEVVIRDFPEYENFKKLILNEQPKDTSFQIFGVPKVIMNPFPELEKKEYLNPFFIFFIRYMHYIIHLVRKDKKNIKCNKLKKKSLHY